MKLTRGPLKGMKVEMAPTSRIERLEPEVQRVLEALGHPEAWVTDESQVGDFYTREDGPELLTPVSAALGLSLQFEDYIADVAEKLRGVS